MTEQPWVVVLKARGNNPPHVFGTISEIWRLYGPMTFVQCVSPTEEEVPF